MLLCLGSAAWAETHSGTWGALHWTLDNDGLLTISGSGAMNDIYINQEPNTWLAYRDDIVTAVLEEGVTSLGNRAFYRCTALESVTLPASLTGPVGQNAFSLCSALTAIAADPENTAYGSADGVLFSKDGKTLIRCPEGKTGTYAIPAGVTDIGDWAFAGCSGLTEITIPAGVTDIDASAFGNRQGLTIIGFAGSTAETYAQAHGFRFVPAV